MGHHCSEVDIVAVLEIANHLVMAADTEKILDMAAVAVEA